LSVIAAQVSLLQPDTDEVSINVFKIFRYSTYDNLTKSDDIAMLQVKNLILNIKFELQFFTIFTNAIARYTSDFW
jgi:hypothetical protein